MKLSKQTTDCVEILVHCKRHSDDLLKVADIAFALGLTRQMALKLCYTLNQAGFLDTVRGPKGGVRLSETAADATLGEIVRALEVQPADRRDSASAVSQMDGFFDEAFQAFLSVLDGHTLADLAAQSPAAPAKPKRGRKGPAQAARIGGRAAVRALAPRNADAS